MFGRPGVKVVLRELPVSKQASPASRQLQAVASLDFKIATKKQQAASSHNWLPFSGNKQIVFLLPRSAQANCRGSEED